MALLSAGDWLGLGSGTDPPPKGLGLISREVEVWSRAVPERQGLQEHWAGVCGL